MSPTNLVSRCTGSLTRPLTNSVWMLCLGTTLVILVLGSSAGCGPTSGPVAGPIVDKGQPANPDPTDPDPANPDPTDPDPANPDPTDPDPANPDLATPDPSDPDPGTIGPVPPAGPVSATANQLGESHVAIDQQRIAFKDSLAVISADRKRLRLALTTFAIDDQQRQVLSDMSDFRRILATEQGFAEISFEIADASAAVEGKNVRLASVSCYNLDGVSGDLVDAVTVKGPVIQAGKSTPISCRANGMLNGQAVKIDVKATVVFRR